jgi:hypothetical protein
MSAGSSGTALPKQLCGHRVVEAVVASEAGRRLNDESRASARLSREWS